MTRQNGSDQTQTFLVVVICESVGPEEGLSRRAGDYFGTCSSAVTGGPFWGRERLSSHSIDICLQGRLRVSRLKREELEGKFIAPAEQ